jgi:CxxC-x17-CxxC domain-containing protein
VEDKTLTCRDCGQDFIFTVGEQQFYAQIGLLNEPGRCPACRAARRSGQRSTGAPREMHAVTCAECGNQAMVPFLPQQNKPVYCSSCFEKVRAGLL